MNPERILVIGLDGATFDLLKPWVAQGYLPNLATLMEKGCHAPLLSTLQPTTAPAWVTFMTGMNQGKHGLYDFVRRRADSYYLEITNSTMITAPTLFDVAGQQGRRVIAVNIPYTSPARAVQGIMVGGPFAPTFSREMVSPPIYFEEIQKVIPDYFVSPDYDAGAADPMADYAQQLLQEITQRERLCTHLMQSEPWDIFAVVFMATDEVQHTFWHCLDAPEGSQEVRFRQTIREIYQRLDAAIGKLMDTANKQSKEEVTVIILSDHGAGPFRWMINLNQYLAELGHLHFYATQHGRLRYWRTRSLKYLANFYRQYIPSHTRTSLRQWLGANRFTQAKESFESILLTTTVDWSRTKAYALGAGGNIFINLAGREPMGIVQPGEEYEQVRSALQEHLLQMRDPQTNESLIKCVYKREELYHGPQLDLAPDLIIEWRDYACWGRGQYDSQSPVFEAQRRFDFSTQPLTGSHRPEGILIMQGRGIRAGATVNDARLVDMAPTILSLSGISPLAEMDGRVLTELFTEEKIASLPGVTVLDISVPVSPFSHDADGEEKIAEQLRALGYL